MEDEVIFLLDTNIWLERLLEQEKSDEVNEFLFQLKIFQSLISHYILLELS